jgi:hypothetical protein
MADIEDGIKIATILIIQPQPIPAILEIPVREEEENKLIKKICFFFKKLIKPNKYCNVFKHCSL